MPITPTSTLSKNYQALGIDEIANDIETAFTSINATDDALVVLEAQVQAIPGADATTVTVDITSAQLLAGGNIEILPAPGVGMYYEWHKVIIEATSSIPYTFSAGDWQMFLYNSDDLCTIHRQILNADGGYIPISIFSTPYPDETVSGSLIHIVKDINETFGMYLGGTVTGGDGTLRLIITYTVRTFGA